MSIKTVNGKVLEQHSKTFPDMAKAKGFMEAMRVYGVYDFTQANKANGHVVLTWRTREPMPKAS